MAIRRSVVEIDVRDEKFKSFMTSYTKYHESMKKMGGLWDKTHEASRGQLATMQMMSAALLAQSDVMHKVAVNQNDMTNRSRSMADNWRSIARSTKDTASHIYQQVRHLARATGMSTLITGLAMGGSLFGLEVLARSAMAGRRSSTGLGATYGQQTAFGLAYQRLVDTGSFMQGVSTGRGSMGSNAAIAMHIMGMNPSAGGSTGSMSNELLKRIIDLAGNTPEEQLGTVAETHMLGEFGIGVEEMRRFRKIAGSPKERKELEDRYAKQSNNLNLSDPTLKAWADFDTQLQTAGEKLKTGLIAGLVALADPLSHLTDAFSDFLKQFLGSGGFKSVIESFARGLEIAGKYVSSDAFKTDMDRFGEALKRIWEWLVKVADWFDNSVLGRMVSASARSGDASRTGNDADLGGYGNAHWKDQPGSQRGGYNANVPGAVGGVAGGAAGAGVPGSHMSFPDKTGYGSLWRGIKGFFGGGNKFGGNKFGASAPGRPGSISYSEMVSRFVSMGWSEEQARGLATNIMAESSGIANKYGDGGQAYGLAQWHPDRQAIFKSVFGHDIRESTVAEQMQFIDWELRHNEAAAGMRLRAATERGDAAAIVSKYYERPKDVEGAAANRRNDARGVGGGGGSIGPGVRVTINDNTGGAVVPTVTQMATAQ